MDKKKEIYDKINKATEDIVIPDKLRPENIMETIGEQQAKDSIHPRVEHGIEEARIINDNSSSKKIINFKGFRNFALVAAALVVVVMAVKMPDLLTVENENAAFEATTGDAIDNENVISRTVNNVSTGNIESYDDVYTQVKKQTQNNSDRGFWNVFFGTDTNEKTTATEGISWIETAENVDSALVDVAGGDDYSTTNVQTEGIDEGDVIKTDGKYIYYGINSFNRIDIYEAKGEDTSLVSKLYVDGMGYFDEFYIDENMLIVVGGSYRDSGEQVNVAQYDITNKEKPLLVGSYTQDGYINTTRKIGDLLYVVTQKSLDLGILKKSNLSTYIPMVDDEFIPVDSIYVPEEVNDNYYTIMTCINVTTDLAIVDTAAVYGFGGQFYMGSDSIYLYRGDYEDNTIIKKIPYSNGDFGKVLEGNVPGSIRDVFAVNEYNGYLRVMTTSYKKTGNNYYGTTVNNVFVLDDAMSIVGSIEGLAEGERIYSARYMQDVAYFVTYRETDPLFSVDLSVPENPKIMGALKIPGFSEYLHKYSDDLLLGIGIEIESDSNSRNEYIKLSMFDTSDPYDVTEKDKMILYDMGYSAVLYDYKLVMIDPKRNIFGFAGSNPYGDERLYKAFTYGDNGFVEIISVKIGEETDFTRSVYIGDYLYLLGEEEVKAYSIKNVK